MTIDANIDSVIHQLKEFKKQGYTTVEVIDKSRRHGWKKLNPELTFVFNSEEPTVLGIGVSSEKYLG